jgi:hypothetical protein
MDPPGTLSAKQRFRAGTRTGIGLAAAAFVLAVTFGATARAQGWGEIVVATALLRAFVA